MAVTITPEQAHALEILRACDDATRIAFAQALLPPGLEVMSRPSQERLDALKAALSDGLIDISDVKAVRQVLGTD